jgi:hypothetical protein
MGKVGGMLINLRWGFATPFLCASALVAQQLPSAPAERCVPVRSQVPSATDWLERAARAVLPGSTVGRGLRVTAITEVDAWEQSDRSYEPFLPLGSSATRWTDLTTGVKGWTPTARLSVGADTPCSWPASTARSRRATRSSEHNRYCIRSRVVTAP